MLHNNNFRFILVPAVLFIVSLIFVGAARITPVPPSLHIIKWVVEKNSSLRVDGKSNVNCFTCNINEYAAKDTILCANDLSGPVKLSGNLQMDILSFDCHSNFITKDLRKTLKADEYPKMIIRFLSLQSMPVLNNKTELINGCLEVELAGVVKRFDLCYSFSRTANGFIQLNGGRKFCFSDFKLSPPRKLAGLVRIKDEFDVNFQLSLRAL